eukprot:1184269-Prorocentrum_minimum.AAC.2
MSRACLQATSSKITQVHPAPNRPMGATGSGSGLSGYPGGGQGVAGQEPGWGRSSLTGGFTRSIPGPVCEAYDVLAGDGDEDEFDSAFRVSAADPNYNPNSPNPNPNYNPNYNPKNECVRRTTCWPGTATRTSSSPPSG